MVKVASLAVFFCFSLTAFAPISECFDGFPEYYDGETMDIGAACPDDNPKCCVNEGRLDSYEKFFSIQADTLSTKRANSLVIEELYRNITAPDAVLRVNGVGFYPTPMDAVEYMTMVQGTANNDLFVFLQINPKFDDIVCIAEDRWNATPVKTIQWLNPAENGYLYEENEIRDTIEPYTFTFAPNSSLIAHITGQIPDPLSVVALSKRQSVRTLCETLLLYCPGDYYPYEGLAECYETMSRIPNNCPTGLTGNPRFGGGSVQGDTLVCRFLHLISSNYRPEYHCAHLANESVKCPAELCPAATRLEVPAPVFENQYENATHSDAIRAFEMFILASFWIIGLASMTWHHFARKAAFMPRNQKFVKQMTQPISDTTEGSESKTLPVLRFQHMKLSWLSFNSEKTDGVVVEANEGFLGGYKMTCIIGESGSGKSTFLKLLSGFSAPHMELSYQRLGDLPCIVYCPQFSEMWPNEMPVRDILVFACKMVNVNAFDSMETFKQLGIAELLDQPFYTLSGGQRQRVNIATILVHPKPSIIILDEPLASLDKDNAVAALEVIRHLPVAHSFVLTVHQFDRNIASRFDRIVHFDSTKKALVTRKGAHDAAIFEDKSEMDGAVSMSMIPSTQACLTLWHGQMFGKPWLEIGMVLFTIVAAVFTALIGRPSLAYEEVPTSLSLRIPIYVSLMLFGATFMTSYGVSLVYAQREKPLVSIFIPQNVLNPFAYVLSMTLRSVFYGVVQATVWVLVSLPLLNLWGDKVDIILANAAIFTAAWTCATFFAALGTPFAATHIVMIMCVYAVFLSGPFNLWKETYGFIRFLQSINPLFYVVSANIAVVLEYFDPGCDNLTHPGTCAQANYILEANQTQDVSSLGSQLGCLLVFLLTITAATYFLYPRSQVSPAKESIEPLSTPTDVRNSSGCSSHRSSMHQHRSKSGRFSGSDINPDWKSLSNRLSTSISNSQVIDFSAEFAESHSSEEMMDEEVPKMD